MKKLILTNLRVLLMLFFSFSVSAENTPVGAAELAPPSITCSPFSSFSVDNDCELKPNSKLVYNIIITDDSDATVNVTETVTDGDGNPFYSEENLTFDASPTGEQTTVRIRELMTPGTYNYTITVENSASETDVCSFTINVTDDNQPMLSCPGTFIAPLDETGAASISTEEYAAAANFSDNCSDVADLTVGLTTNSFTCDDVGGSGLTFTVTDEAGNVTACSASITIVDETPPTPVCQPVSVVLSESGSATVLATQVDNGSSDICSATTLTISVNGEEAAPSIFVDCMDVPSLPVTLFVTDASNNTSTCTTTITVEDNSTLTAECRDITASLDADGNVTILPDDIDNGSEGCISNLSLDNDNFTCDDIGTNIVELTVSSLAASSSCTAVVLVEDTSSPFVTCQDLTIELDEAGTGLIDITEAFTEITDNCTTEPDFSLSIVGVSVDVNCDDIGTFSPNPIFTATDEAGNFRTCRVSVVVEDNTAPTITCPEDVTVAANESCFFTGLSETVTTDDNCGIFQTSFSRETLNSAIVDTVPPFPTFFPGDFPADFISGLSLEQGETQLNFGVEDTAGNTQDCSFIVTVEDQTPPVANCADVVIQIDENGFVDFFGVFPIDQGGTDNCTAADDLSSVFNLDLLDCDFLGENEVSLTFTDEAGNSNTCIGIATLEDNISPTALCQDITVSLDETGTAIVLPTDVDNGSDDNCGIAEFSLDFATFTCDDTGVNPVVLTVSDASGNSDTCNANITVEDTTAPVAICQDVTIELSFDGEVTLLATQIDNGSDDNCGIAEILLCPSFGQDNSTDGVQTMASSNFAFACENINDDITATLFVTDVNENTSICTATITVEDNEVPTAECQDLNVALDATGNATIAAADIDNGSTDNCSTLSFSADVTSFDCAAIGENTVTLTVTDEGGNEASCTATVSVEDNTAPDIECQIVTIQLDADGFATVDPADANNGSTDNCTADADIVFGIGDFNGFDCDNVGSRSVTFFATDESGNFSECSGTIIVEDNIPPTFSCPGDQTVDTNTGCLFTGLGETVSVFDNCNVFQTAFSLEELNSTIIDTVQLPPTLIPGSPSATFLSDLFFQLGETELTFEAEDDAGNTESCIFSVIVEDQTIPDAACQDVNVQLDADGNVSITVAQVNIGSDDNCTNFANLDISLDQTEFTCDDIGENIVTLTVIDESGNEDECLATITVEDNLSPQFPPEFWGLCGAITLNVDENGQAETVTIADLGVLDNCTEVSDLIIVNPPEISCNAGNLGFEDKNFTVVDEAGNSSNCNYAITLVDNIPPTISCPSDVTVNANNPAGFNNFSETVTFTENCSVSSLSVIFTNPDGSSSTNELDINNPSLAEGFFDFGTTNIQHIIEDAGGNTAQCSFNLTVEDQTPPTAICQNAVVVLDENGNGSITPDQINNGSNDNSTADEDLILLLDQTDFDCSTVGENTVTLTVADETGNDDTCTATVTVEDNTAPDIDCRPVTIELNEAGIATVNPADANDGSTDNCTESADLIFALVGTNEFDCDDVGGNSVTFTATDEAGNESECSGNITVEDNILPTINCPIDITVTADEACTFTGLTEAVSFSDNCTLNSFSSSQNNPSGSVTTENLDVNASSLAELNFELGETLVELSVNDSGNNTASCTFTVIVTDDTAPTAICTGTVIQLDENGNGSISPNQINNGSNDNCTAANALTLSLSQTAFTCADTGSNTVTLTVIDEAGNEDTCDATVTVEDNIAPTAICQDFTVQLDNAGVATINPADANNGTTDNCTAADNIVFELSEGELNFDCEDLGDILLNFTATDESDNSSFCTVTVTVEDNISPTLSCVGSVQPADLNCQFVGGGAQFTIFDNCSPVTFEEAFFDEDGNNFLNGEFELNSGSFVLGAGRIFPLGANTVVFTATDASGNSETCSVVIEVVDMTAPDAVCQDASVNLDEDGNASISVADIENGSSDICTADDALILSLNQTTFTCADIGSNTVILSVIDEAGNENTCDATVTVEDNIAPTAICQDFTVQLDNAGNAPVNAADADNGSTDNCSANTDLTFTVSGGSVTFTCADIGANTLEITVTDESGNASSCTSIVTVEDNIIPAASCKNIIVLSQIDGTATANPADVNNNSTDNCTANNDLSFALDQTSFDCTVSITNTVTLTVTDEAGNTDTCTATVTGEDNIPPTAICQDITVQLNDLGVATINPADVNNGTTDNCTADADIVFDISDGELNLDCSNIGDNLITFTATDESDNTSFCFVTVTVEDNIVPTLTNCVGSVQSADLNCQFIGGGAQFTIFDNCDFVVFDEAYFDEEGNNFLNEQSELSSGTFELGAGRIFPLGANTVVFTATDASGNSETCSVVIEVVDTTAPNAICQDATAILDEEGNASVSVADIENGSTDNCTAAADLTFALAGNTQFSCNDTGNNGVTLNVTDEAGNVGSCSANVTLIDNTPAEIECRQPVSTTTSPGVCGAEDLTILEPFALFDNCGAENVTFTRIPAGNDFPVGETVLNWTATDASGNTSTCQSLVFVQDSEAPTISFCNTAIDFVEPGSCLAQVVVSADIFDNCGVASVTGTGVFSLPFGIHPNPITVTDINGNVTVHDFTIFVHDDLNPVFANCPSDTVLLQAGIDGTAPYPVQTPVATDNCGVPTITNDLPEDDFPIGSSVVTFIAEDEYGNTTDCVVNVEVLGGIAMHPQDDIESSLAENETSQNVAWNALNATTFCELCEETELEGFQYIGTWWGHQYFLANESSLTRDEANLIAEGYDAHLAVINDAAENAYLTEALDENTRSAWIGLLPEFQEEEWTFAWDNGDVFDFELLNFDSITADTRIILGNDGTWKEATSTEDKYFLLERPCVDFVQTAPMYAPEVEEGEEEIPAVLLRSGDAWPEGEYEVTYALTDMCGNESALNFEVDVLPEIAEYCTSVATNNSVWIEKIVFHDLVNESEDNEGYADFTEETTTMNIGDGVVLLRLEAGGNEAEDSLFWNVYLDANADGDFFDAGEMLYQIASREAVEVNLDLPIVFLENARLRVMVSRYDFAAPCGDTYVGEIEDYNVNLLISEDYARATCEVQVAALNAERMGMNAELDWTVNSVCPIDNYTVEYSSDGQDFVAITQMAAQNVSDIFYNENFATALPDVLGTLSYRIKVQPADEPAFYTNTINFDLNDKPSDLSLYPNPADNYVRVALMNFAGIEGRIVIYDNMGKLRMSQNFAAITDDEITLDLREFTDGIYHVSIEANGKRTQTKRLIINKLYGWNAVKN